MRILVLSDNHLKGLKFNPSNYDAIIHAGDRGNASRALKDYKAFYVCGNCDITGEKSLVFNLFNKKIFLTHGDLYNVKLSLNSLIYAAMEKECDICIYGHTHIPDCFIEEGILFLNPGAYKDGFYAIIGDEKIEIYLNGEVFRTINYRW